MSAVTENNYTSNGSQTNYSFTFPYLKTSDVKVSLDGVETSNFTFANATTIQLNNGATPPVATAPAFGVKIRILRETTVDNLTATFYAGSAIKSEDLNDNFTQNLYVTQEVNQRYVPTTGGTFTGNLDLGNNKITNLGDPVNATDAVNKQTLDSTIETDVLAGTDLSKTASGGQVTINHDVAGANTTINNSNGNVIQDLTISAQGHVTSAGSVDLDTRYYTETELDAGALDPLYFRQDSSETIASGDTWSAGDTHVATTAAIDARIIDLVDEVGGFDIVNDEQSFPDTNPGGTTGQAAVLSIKAASTDLVPTGTTVTITNGNLANNANITINNVPSTIAQGFGFLVESTSTLHTYTFHRLVPKATEVTTVASNATAIANVGNNIASINTANGNITNIDIVATNISNVNPVGQNIAAVNSAASNIANINNFTNNYQIRSSAPTTDGGGNALSEGNLYFDTTSDELKVYNGGTWQGGVTATGNLAGLGSNTFTGDQNISNNQELRLFEATGNGTNYVGLKAPNSVTNDVTFTLPAADGNNGEFLKTDGNGQLSFVNNLPSSLYDWTTISTSPVAVTTAGNGAFEILSNNKLSFDRDPTNTNKTSLQAPASQPNDLTLTLPAADGTANQALMTDGNGILSFGDVSSGGLTGGGTDELFIESDNVMSTNFTTTTNKNYLNLLPLTINATLTVTDGSFMRFVAG